MAVEVPEMSSDKSVSKVEQKRHLSLRSTKEKKHLSLRSTKEKKPSVQCQFCPRSYTCISANTGT